MEAAQHHYDGFYLVCNIVQIAQSSISYWIYYGMRSYLSRRDIRGQFYSSTRQSLNFPSYQIVHAAKHTRCYSSRKFLHKSPCIIINPRPHREEIKSLNRRKSFFFPLLFITFSFFSLEARLSYLVEPFLDFESFSFPCQTPQKMSQHIGTFVSFQETTLASINGKWPDYLSEQVDHFTAIISYESPTVHPKQHCSSAVRVTGSTLRHIWQLSVWILTQSLVKIVIRTDTSSHLLLWEAGAIFP